VLAEGLVDRVVMGEIDPHVSAVWQCALSSQNERLCKRIVDFQISRRSVLAELKRDPLSSVDRAFQTILRNRTYRGGILASGASLMKEGENGRGVASRWYPQTLARRLGLLQALSPLIEFFEMDAIELIREYLDRRDVAYFIDPPYTAGNGKRAGRRLYQHNELDHEALFDLLGTANGLVLMTYDDSPAVIEMASRRGFSIERVPMKNAHHEKKCELLISNSAQLV
jgi:DNA adenine methylase